MTLSLVGLSHHVAPVELRERVTLDARRRARRSRASLGDAVCLSTCNRTELYLADGDEERGRRRRSRSSPASRSTACSTGCTTRRPRCTSSASRPGSTRSCPGEGEILGQVRAAYEAVDARAAARPRLPAGARRRQARAHRDRDRREPRVGLARPRPRSPRRCSATSTGARVLLIGAGRIGELAAANLSSRGAQIAYVANRTRRHGPRARAPLRRRSRSRSTDVALRSSARSTSSSRRRARPSSSLRAGDVPARRRQPLFFIDIAVPRDLDPAIGTLDGCFLYDIDDLEAVVAETLAGRRAEAERAEQLVAEEARALPRVAGLARRRAGDRLAARARRGDPLGRAREGRRPVSDDERRDARVGDGADPEQAPASADGAHEGGRGQRRRRRLRRGRRATCSGSRSEER